MKRPAVWNRQSLPREAVIRLLGPVFWYDLVRVARRQQLALWRGAYGLGLLAALFVLYVTELPTAWLGGYVSDQDAAKFAGRFFDVFTAVQFAAVILMTPALAANAVTEERGNNTLVFLLTTHLTNREILVGKLATRLLQVGLLVLTGVPVLAILQLMGGVEPMLVVGTFAALAVTAVDLACLGLFCGVFVRKHQTAAWRAYQIMIVYLALSMLSIWYWELPSGPRDAARMAYTSNGWLPWPSGVRPVFGTPPATPPPFVYRPTGFLQFLEWFNTLNPYYAQLDLEDLQHPLPQSYTNWLPANSFRGASLNEALATVLRRYVGAHGALALLLGGLAVWRLRAVAAKQTGGLTHKKKVTLRAAPHPPVRNRPVLWKELYCEARPRQRWLRLFFGRWFYVASFFPAFFAIILSLDTAVGFRLLAERTLFLLRYVGTGVVGLLCLRVAMHAARSIGGERDRQTLDALLTTQLPPAEIVRDKWWGSLLAGRWVFLWLAAHWCLGMLPMALHPLAVPALAVETFVYAAFAASLGLFFAAWCKTTRQALTATLVVGLVGTTLLPWGFGKLAGTVFDTPPPPQPINAFTYRYGPPPAPVAEHFSLGLVPPWVLARTVVPNGDLYRVRIWYDDEPIELLPAVFGLSVYAAAAWALAVAARRQFERSVAGRRRRGIETFSPLPQSQERGEI